MKRIGLDPVSISSQCLGRNIKRIFTTLDLFIDNSVSLQSYQIRPKTTHLFKCHFYLFCSSSVPLPKDVSSFRAQREEALRAGLQVANTVPLQSQADLMEKEMESCLSLEYTPESLPPLLHQVRTAQYKGTKKVNKTQFLTSVFAVLCRQIISLGSDQICTHAAMEEILSTLGSHREALPAL